jgi:peptide/histidine transporter 3/4
MLAMGLAFHGTTTNLQIYLIKEYNVESIDAAQIANIFRGSLNLVPLAGAILSDSFFGCFPVILVGTAINLLVRACPPASLNLFSSVPNDCYLLLLWPLYK